MKKIISIAAILFAAAAALTLSACGSSSSNNTGSDADIDAEAEAGQEAEAETEPAFIPAENYGKYFPAAVLTTFRDQKRNRDLTGTIWYPTETTEGDIIKYQDLIAFGKAIDGAPLAAGGPFPLIVFSHGHQAFDAQSFFLTEHLASHGYIVAACDHVGDTTGSYKQGQLATAAFNRPQDVSAMLDEMLARNKEEGNFLKGAIDEDKIGMSGHSFGAFTTFADAGGSYDFALVKAKCDSLGRENWHGPWWICPDAESSDLSCLDACDGACKFGDSRIKAAVPMCPGMSEAFGEASIAAINIPMLVMGGEMDDTLPLDVHMKPFFRWLTQKDSMEWILAGGSHMTFSNMCQIISDPGIGCGPGFIEAERAWLLINTATTAFFGVHLKGDARYKKYFESEYLNGSAAEVTLQKK